MRYFAFLAVCLLAVCTTARAGVVYFNGFEPGDPGTADFYDSTTNTQGADITIVPNGGGALGLTAPGGTNYAEITNVHDSYQFVLNQTNSGYGESVYTDYGASAGIPISGPFSESTDYYIDTSWAAASADSNYVGFWIDTTPNSDPGYLDETNFRIIDNPNNPPGTIGVAAFAGNPGTNGTVATITTSGWYTFKTTFEDTGGFVSNTMSLIDSLGNTVGSFTGVSTLPFSDLTGTNYGDWTTVWENGFANDVLGIDNVEVDSLSAVPLPSTAWTFLTLIGGVACFGGFKRLRATPALAC